MVMAEQSTFTADDYEYLDQIGYEHEREARLRGNTVFRSALRVIAEKIRQLIGAPSTQPLE